MITFFRKYLALFLSGILIVSSVAFWQFKNPQIVFAVSLTPSSLSTPVGVPVTQYITQSDSSNNLVINGGTNIGSDSTTCGAGEFGVKYSDGGLPSGMFFWTCAVTHRGLFTGTPASAGSFPVTLHSYSDETDIPFTITVTGGAVPSHRVFYISMRSKVDSNLGLF